MRKVLGLSLALVVALTAVASGKPVNKNSEFRPEVPDLSVEQRMSGGPSLSYELYVDTTSYGGTYWAADSLRWEAIKDSVWTFNTGVGSSINVDPDGIGPLLPPNVNKPGGYHQQMEGWYGIDQTLNPLPYFRASGFCVLTGAYSLHAGVDATEAAVLCYAGGSGYGNAWHMEVQRTFTYAGAGNVAFSYQYAVDSEPNFDFAYVEIDTTGNGASPNLTLATYTGLAAGSFSTTLTEGSSMRSDAGDYTIYFIADSDGSYSDEDGLYTTTCGLATFDNINVDGGLTTFESGTLEGWTAPVATTGVGDFSNIVDLTVDLPPPVAFCPCGLRDSVLVFYDQLGFHPDNQDNMVASPWIDLLSNGDAGKPGKLMLYDVYAEMPLANYIFVQLRARYYPDVCPVNGLVRLSPWKDQNIVFYFGETPFCNPSNAPRLRDYSAVIAAGAEQLQVGFGMLSLCATAPFGVDCTGITNTTPWMDNINIGVFGANTAPNVGTTTFDRFQDNFSADGTLNPSSPGRFDVNRIKNGSNPSANTILGDTLTARGDGGNTEVYMVFRVRPGAFVNAAALAALSTKWGQNSGAGENLVTKFNTACPPPAGYLPTWYAARMDTAEQGGLPNVGIWMTAFHEAELLAFSAPDNGADPFDNSRGPKNDFLPDHVFTPGSHVDYFIASRYTDGRNPGGEWYTEPKTLATGNESGAALCAFREVEILPSSMAADSSWNCTLYVDHHDDRNLFDQVLEEAGLNASLGAGGNTAEGTRYDRFDNQTPSSGQLSFGRPVSTQYGCATLQMFAYKNVAWFSATLSSGDLTNEDAYILNPWLTLVTVGNNRFWGSGSSLAHSMHLNAVGTASRSFLNNTMATTRTCNTIRDTNCPVGTVTDATYCLPMNAVGGSHFASSIVPRGRGNGCPDLESFDLLGSTANSLGQLSYTKTAVVRNYASVSRHNVAGVDFKTVIDGVALGRMRTNDGTFAAGCDVVTASAARADDVLDWFASTLSCKVPANLSDVPVDGGPKPPAFRHSLGNAYPNPMNPSTRIQFTNGVNGGKVTLQIFDVTGRLVKTLVDGSLPAGVHESSWDGSDNTGGVAPNGMYFYRMAADDFVSAKKLLMMKK